MIVTIDGPAASGKSSVARALAARLGFEFLDTGAMYRAVALAALRAGVSPRDEAMLAPVLASLRLEMPAGRIHLNGEDVTEAIRTPQLSAGSSAVATLPSVRRKLVEMQRTVAAGRDVVTEGRDQGTVVFPDAVCKFFLTADARERARRRQAEMAARGEHVDLEALVRDQEERDRQDAGRAVGPMRQAADAVLVDSTHLTFDEVLQRLEAEVRRRMAS